MPVERLKSITGAGLPSPLARKERVFLPDRSAGAMTRAPGLNIAPAQAQGSGGLIEPFTRIDRLLLLAPPAPPAPPAPSSSASEISQVERPRWIWSVETDQPRPKA